MNLLFISKISMFSWKKFISSKNNLCSALIDYMIQVPIINYNLRHFQKLANTKKNSVKMGLETILYHTPQLWNLVSIDIKDTLSLSTFKKKKIKSHVHTISDLDKLCGDSYSKWTHKRNSKEISNVKYFSVQDWVVITASKYILFCAALSAIVYLDCH